MNGDIKYFIASDSEGRGPDRESNGSASEITAWVKVNFTATEVGGIIIYNLAQIS
ncbi:hypothetical protein AB0M22_30610 [Nocardia sp. NPDC051756]|uniref:hypothetical protein n=1 Tax=Nocardia sp. NPDC051756 TaxID=3154751 RepID=UPI0034337C61